MIPLDSYTVHSADGKLVPVVPGGNNIPLTFANRNDYVEHALHYRLHEMDQQVNQSSHLFVVHFKGWEAHSVIF